MSAAKNLSAIIIRLLYNNSYNTTFKTTKTLMFSVNQNSKLLTNTKTPLEIARRTNMAQTTDSIKISVQHPLADYKALIENMMDSIDGDEEQMQRYKAIAAETRKVVWNLLFLEPTAENQKKAFELLKEHKMDACFYVPWDYNEWIVAVRDEVLKREMFDFWHKMMVKESLGPCWAKDSDYFDDLEDPEPALFYHHAGAVAAWESPKQKDETETASEVACALPTPNQSSGSTQTPIIPSADDLKINLVNPLEEYKRLIEEYLSKNEALNDEQIADIYKRIAENAVKTVWSLVFDDPQPPTADRQKKAGDLLREHKSDACFYAPWVYNEWIVKFRDELLKREVHDFWREYVVKQELGLCWAKDTDFYDDMEDPEPAKFYKYAGCCAPWLKEESQNKANESKRP